MSPGGEGDVSGASAAPPAAGGAPLSPATSAVLDPAFLQRLERLTLVARRTLRGLGRGDRRSKRQGGTVEFADYRRYARGDDVRRIDWFAFARFESLFLKLFAEEQDLAAHVLVDASASMRVGSKLPFALRAAAALGYVALAAGDRVDVRAFVAGESAAAFGPARGRGRLTRLLQHLDRIERSPTAGTTSLALAANAFLARHPEPGVVLLISDFLDAERRSDGAEGGAAAAAGRLRAAGHEPFLLQVVSPEEAEPALGDEVDLIDAETGASVAVTLDRTALAAYRERFAAFVGALEATARRLEVGHFLARTDRPFEDLILELCKRRALAS